MNAQTHVDRLHLFDQGISIKNRIEIEVPAKVYKNIKKSRDQKVYWKDSKILLNGSETMLDEAHTRGSTSHDFSF